MLHLHSLVTTCFVNLYKLQSSVLLIITARTSISSLLGLIIHYHKRFKLKPSFKFDFRIRFISCRLKSLAAKYHFSCVSSN
jgi:hypothetical protein